MSLHQRRIEAPAFDLPRAPNAVHHTDPLSAFGTGVHRFDQRRNLHRFFRATEVPQNSGSHGEQRSMGGSVFRGFRCRSVPDEVFEGAAVQMQGFLEMATRHHAPGRSQIYRREEFWRSTRLGNLFGFAQRRQSALEVSAEDAALPKRYKQQTQLISISGTFSQ